MIAAEVRCAGPLLAAVSQPCNVSLNRNLPDAGHSKISYTGDATPRNSVEPLHHRRLR